MDALLVIDMQEALFRTSRFKSNSVIRYTTIRSAVSHNLNVVVVSDGHTTADRPHLDAQFIIGHHNWMWSTLITPNAPVVLVTAADLLAELLPKQGNNNGSQSIDAY
jgi:nicotinamidase-related amidase